MPVRHNIDVMHVEKKVSDALLSILMHNAKSKDGLKARKDLEDMGIRRTLHSEVRGKKTYLPPASYWLSKAEKIRFCRRLSKFRGPDGYCANVGNCVSVEPPAIGNMKSHDHHVLIQNLFHVALRGLLHKGPRIAARGVYAEGYLAGECLAFCLEFLQNSLPVQDVVNRNEDIDSDQLALEGRPLQKATQVTLTDKERDIAHRYILMNTAVMDPYVESSARDSRHTADIVTFYGVVKEIILLDYHMFQVPLFRYVWANKGNGVKEEEAFTLVNLYMNQSAFLQDPYILASQAKQVFYSREDDTSPWYVVMRTPPRGYHEL
ncbi:unnamed protein product [Microthlaspi erraticum]|uniref:DUF4216 domain-containing protein n=1 Tax=Microthlaspi erraticum TaxID=1685480 RepID=A0A6D2JG92_9BRAS|nr:unnamed protein product [Microthlaspi erraticum]